jgi:hypothetical protein
MTMSTWGRSSPLAATSVARRTEGAVCVAGASENAARVRVRADGGRCPCSENSAVSGGRRSGRTWNT